VATTHVHANCRRFISRTGGWRSALTSGRHSIRFHKSRLPCGTRCRLVFGVVAFPPPPVTSPATRPKSEDLSDLRLLRRLIISSKRDTVFIRVAQDSLATFRFSAGCDSCNSRLLLLSNNASPHRLPFPSLVTTPVSTATRMWVIRSPAIRVKQKIL
jgi:hypothetical protein